MKYNAEDVEAARETLLALLPVGSDVWTNIVHSTRSGSAHVQLLVMSTDQDGKPYPRDITHLAAKLLGERVSDHGGIVYGGWGYSKTFHAVYSLARLLRPSGHKCTGSQYGKGKTPRCPSNDHNNDYNGFAHAYRAEHDPECRAQDYYTPEGRAFRDAERTAWEAAQPRLWSKRRQHSDSGYSLNERQL